MKNFYFIINLAGNTGQKVFEFSAKGMLGNFCKIIRL